PRLQEPPSPGAAPPVSRGQYAPEPQAQLLTIDIGSEIKQVLRNARRGETMPRKRIAWRLGLAGALVAGAAALALVLTAGGGSHDKWSTSKFAGGDPDAAATSQDTPGEGPIGGYEAYLSA